MSRRKLVPAAIATAGLLCLVVASGTAAADIEQERVRIRLLGANEIPVNVHGNQDRGVVTVIFQDEDESDPEEGAEPLPTPSASAAPTTELCFRFGNLTLTEGEPLPHVAHIHLKNPGQPTGGVIQNIFGTGDTVPAPAEYPTGKICVQAPVSLVEDIIDNPQDYYVNLHNATHPSGVVRGDFPGDL